MQKFYDTVWCLFDIRCRYKIDYCVDRDQTNES